MSRAGLLRFLLPALVILILAIQFLPVDRQAPPTDGLVDAPDPVMTVLKQSCFDCHSNQTQWPWYGYIAPFSWLIQDHVGEAREELDFTAWNQYDEDERLDLQEDVWDEVDLEEMPPAYYVLLHPEARITQKDREILEAWADAASF